MLGINGIGIFVNKLWAELNLRKKLSMAFVITTVFPLALATIITSWITENAMENFVFDRNKHVAEIIASDINHMFAEKVRMVKFLASDPDILSRDQERQFGALRGIATQYLDIQDIIVVDAATGKQIVRSDGRQLDIDVSDREYFKDAKAGKSVISDIIASGETEAKSIIIAEPIQGNDQIIHEILLVSIDIQNIIDTIGETKIGTTGYAYIVNKEGRALIHPDVESGTDLSYLPPVKGAISGQKGSTRSEFAGQKRLDGYSYILITKWGLIAQQPLDEAMSGVNSVEKTNILILTCSAALAILIGLAMAGALAKPITEISKAAESLAEGNVTVHLPVTTQDEIGKLAATFNNMTTQITTRDEALRQAYDDLEIKVAERTQELFAANEELTAMNEELTAMNEEVQDAYTGLEVEVAQRIRAVEQVEQTNRQIEKAFAELKNAQLQIIQQEKMASIGQMAAGVAHEINNPLGFVSSNFDTLQKYNRRMTEMIIAFRELHMLVKKIPSLQESAERISALEKQKKIDYILEDLEPIFTETMDGLNRVSNIVKALRLFSRADQQDTFEEYNINEGVKNTLIVARNELKYVAEIKENLTEVPTVKVIGGQVNQVLLNMIINAAHAIKAKGADSLGLITINTYSDEQNVYCAIGDSGTGIPEEIRKDIFSPFFTTKKMGQGTGLGLSISYDIIVNKHHGEILLNSEMGVGTTFTIKLSK